MILLKIDPDQVGPGGTAFLIVLVLAVVVVFLIWSMRRRMRKISLPHRGEIDPDGAESRDGVVDTEPDDPQSDSAEQVDGQDAGDGTRNDGLAEQEATDAGRDETSADNSAARPSAD